MDALAAADICLFEDFRLDRRGGGLFRRGEHGIFVPTALGSRALGVLGVLADRPGDLISRDEIVASVSPTTVVEDNNLNIQIAALRRVLDDRRTEGSCIQTVPGRGYRFILAVTRVEAEGHAKAAEAAAPGLPARLTGADKPSIAVLPFQNMSGDPEQEYFADGMVEDIITALSRIRWLFVIARNSSFSYKGRAVDVKEVGRELGVRYALEGSVRKAGTRVRITAQLVDALTGTHLWADRFDGSLEDVFELQDKIAVRLAGIIEPTLQAAEMHRSAARPTRDLTAYDLYLRALAALYPITKVGVFEALGLLEKAIAIDRRYGPALARAAYCHRRLIVDGWADEPETSRREAIDLARQAIQVAQNDPGTLAYAAFTLAHFGEDLGAMIGLVDRVLALNPSFARGWHLSGVLRIFAGEHDLAIEHLDASLRLSPREQVRAMAENGMDRLLPQLS